MTDTALVLNYELGFGYEAASGELFRIYPGRFWRMRTWYASSNGTPQITVYRGRPPKPATHLIWFLMERVWPERGQVIDHVSGDRSDNSWGNLRLCTHQQNSWNRNKVYRRFRDDSLEKGVTLDLDGIHYNVSVQGDYCGRCDTKQEANALARTIRGIWYGQYDASARPVAGRHTEGQSLIAEEIARVDRPQVKYEELGGISVADLLAMQPKEWPLVIRRR